MLLVLLPLGAAAFIIHIFFIVKVILITTLFSFYLIHYFFFLSLHLFYVRNLTFTPLLMHKFSVSNLYKEKNANENNLTHKHTCMIHMITFAIICLNGHDHNLLMVIMFYLQMRFWLYVTTTALLSIFN